MASPVVDTPIPDQSTQEGVSVSLDVSGNFSDADVTDSLTYSVSGLPTGTGLSIDPNSGVFSGTPNAFDEAAAPFTVTVRATESGTGNFTEASFQMKLPPDVKRWNPGHYALENGSDPNIGDDIFTNSQLDDIAGTSNVVGVIMRIRWVDVEPTRDNYDFSLIQDLYDRCAARGLYLVVQVLNTKFSSTSWGNYLPSYLDTDYSPSGIYAGIDSNGVNRSVVKLYRSALMDRKIALQQAIAAQFDSQVFFEGSVISETSLGVSSNQDSLYSVSGWATQLARLCEEAAPYFTRANMFLLTNFMDQQNTAAWNTVFNAMETYGVGGGGPDAIVNGDQANTTTGDDHFLGNVGTKDYRGSIGYFLMAQGEEMGSTSAADPAKEGDFTPSEIAVSAITNKFSTHLGWLYHNISYFITKWSASATSSRNIQEYLNGTPLSTVQTEPTNH